MDGASYSNGRFGFINFDDYAYITDENGNLIKKVHVGVVYNGPSYYQGYWYVADIS